MADLLATIHRVVAQLVAPILTRAKLTVARGVVRASDDDHAAQELTVTVLAGERMRRVERFAHFGLSSRPPAGAEVVIVCVGGSRAHPIVIADEDRRERPAGELAEGETLLYSTGGARIVLRADGAVEITTPGGLSVDGDAAVAGALDVSGSVTAGADVADALGTLAALRTAYNTHTHLDPQGGSTAPPVPLA